ncbi:hypothetical protein JCM10212_001480 [Sporobolomyces blumeae]
MSLTSSAPPQPAPQVIPCPYTAGGCPLFNTIELPQPSPVQQASPCAGACSPPSATPSYSSRAPSGPPTSGSTSTAPSSDPSLKLPPISRAPPSPGRLPSIDVASPFPRPPSTRPYPLASGTGASPASLVGEEWKGYLEFGLQPSEVDLAPLYVPFPQRRDGAEVGAANETHKHPIWDIEELVPGPEPKRTKRRSPTPTLPAPPASASRASTSSVSSGLVGPADSSTTRPSSPEDSINDVVTPFISKLTYLLDHQEYQPWIRWDALGRYILIAHTKTHLLEILARYFRHTTIASFVRQLNIYGFKRVSTVSLLSILENVSFAQSVVAPNSTEPETFSASDYSAFHNPNFFRSSPGGPLCRLGLLKPITKERGPRNRSKKGQAAAAAAAGSTSRRKNSSTPE